MNEIINRVPLGEEVLDVGPSWEDAKECLLRILPILAVYAGAAALNKFGGVSPDVAAFFGLVLELPVGLYCALSGIDEDNVGQTSTPQSGLSSFSE